VELLVRLFRRETTSKEFIPVIDGLRFLSILMVVIFHTDGYVKSKAAEFGMAPGEGLLARVPDAFVFMGHGVKLFFAISGFILAIPFLRRHFGISERKPDLRAYFVRRLTRLEPPYIISTILIFLILVFVVGSQYPLDRLIPSLFYSLFYVHTLVLPHEFPYVNAVTRSLEIEVQFYILAPLLFWGLSRMKAASVRRVVILGLIAFFGAFSWTLEIYLGINFATVFSFMQYFLAGVLLCDIFLTDREWLMKLGGAWGFLLGLLLLVPIMTVDQVLHDNLFLRVLSPLVIFTFYLVVFGNRLWNKLFSLNALTLIGGMCYSIFLLHTTILAGAGRITNRFKPGNYYTYYWTQVVLLLLIILAVSSMFYLLIEKPCMKRDWHIKLYEKIKGLTLSGEKEPVEENV
jgi:peptidoglycan/LPS O-acetylase OafA/YrhL